MDFDKSNVYTGLNRSDLTIGSKGYFSNTLLELKLQVEGDPQSILVDELSTTDTPDLLFHTTNKPFGFNFFYLTEEAKKGVTDEEYVDFLVKEYYIGEDDAAKLLEVLKERSSDTFDVAEEAKDISRLISATYDDYEDLAREKTRYELPDGIEDFVDYDGYGRYIASSDSNFFIADGLIVELD